MFTQDELTIIARALDCYVLANADLTEEQRHDAQAAAACIRALITGDEARAVLKAADECHDANIGINWDVLSTHLDMLLEEKVGQAAE